MINNWRKFWLSEERITILLCLAGIVFGLITGRGIAEWIDYTPSIEIIGYQIPSLISFGMTVALSTQIVSVLLSWVTIYRGNESHWNSVIWLLIGLPMGILIVLNVFSGYLVALGFVIPYLLDILLGWVVMIIVGWRTMHLFWFNAMSLLPLYIASTGIIWFIEFGRSLV